MIITNFKKLAVNSIRKNALLIAEAGYEAIDIKKSVKRKISKKGDILTMFHQNPEEFGAIKINLNDFKRVFIIGIGKGSALASITLAKILGKNLTGGITLDVNVPNLQLTTYNLQLFKGTHPLPSEINVKATKEIIKLAKSLRSDDLLINFICGGGSALACSNNSELKNVSSITKQLTRAGASISELNMVRRHLSEIKGGGLAKFAYPAAMVSLIVSDVCGNDLLTVASGLTVYDKTTKNDALRIIKKYKLQFKDYKLPLKETPKDKKYFKNVQNMLFVCNQDSVLAMADKARELNLDPKIYSLALEGEAKEIFNPIIKKIKKREVFLAAGETTIKFDNDKKPGKGGRNQEVVLGALVEMEKLKTNRKELITASFASDAHDNTNSAGAIGDLLTIKKSRKAGVDIGDYLSTHSTFDFFEKTGDAVYAKKSCFNVADLFIVLKG